MRYLARYKSAALFALILAVVVGVSVWASRFIPGDYFDSVITPVLMTISATVAFVGAWVVSRHTDGYRFRRAWAWTLLVWGLADGAYVLFWFFIGKPVMNMGAENLTTLELVLGNLLGWTLLLYPAEALRPGWISLKRALWQILPMYALAALDYLLPVKLQGLVAVYPVFLLALLLTYIREYRDWCEENFSSLEDIDVEWIVKYIAMGFLVGVVYVIMFTTHDHARGFTQQWLVIFMLVYSTEQILFRRDPWEVVKRAEKEPVAGQEEESVSAYRQLLQEWMEREKPYQNPDFKLIDLQSVLPMNRTYLSQFIHTEFDCSFYQFVNTYRIQEAKRLMTENPNMKMADISAQCGFSSPSVFSRTFTAIEGKSPRDWGNEI